MNNFTLVFADKTHIEKLTRYRMKLWNDVGKFKAANEYEELFKENLDYLSNLFEQNKIIAPMFIDKRTENIISMGIGIVIQKPPVNRENMGLEGYIYNMFTEKDFRGKGLATKVLNEILKFFNEKCVKRVSLTSNEKSYPLYEKNGFNSNMYHQEIKI